MAIKTHLTTALALSIFLIGLVTPITAQGRVIYVDADAIGTKNGSSWADAYNYLQDALADANSAEKPVEISVAQGIYKPDQGANQAPGNREATFQLINGVALKGGYAGFGASDPNALDIIGNETILSGDLNGDDVEISQPGKLSTDPNRAENCYHVVTGSWTDPNAVVDGFVITAGMANGDPVAKRNGGGAYNDYGSPTFRNCTFLRNMANHGGAVSNWDASPVFINCIFTGNEVARMTFTRGDGTLFTDASSGGGADNTGSSNPVFINCAFYRNRAAYGGAILAWDASSPKLYNCTLSGNIAEFGGAIYNYSYSPATTTITNSILWGNEATINKDEILTGTPFHSSTVVSYTCIAEGYTGTGNINRYPLFVSGRLGDYYLSQRSAGQTYNSPCVDAGCDTATNLGMNELTTRTDEVFDQDIVDMGYHYPKSPPKALIIDGNVEGFETGDFSKFPWENPVDRSWFVTSQHKHSGAYSAQAGAIADDESTTLQVRLNCVSGDILFYCKVSSESGFDCLRFYIDGAEKGKWSGEQDWTEVSFPVTTGTRTFQWTYSKDYDTSRGSDTAWIDNIIFPVP